MDLTGYGTYRHPDCAPLSSFLEVRTKEKRGNRKKGPGSECRDGRPPHHPLPRPTHPPAAPPCPPSLSPTSPPLVGVVWTRKGEGKKRRSGSPGVWGFLLQASGPVTEAAADSPRGLAALRPQSGSPFASPGVQWEGWRGNSVSPSASRPPDFPKDDR
ncbi:hypothetical protein EYF80_042012 [Liparis tanakae]|uniref:Uncharacterized protein n=1 Tax=Liparis tanakae TaxID=230148 RepID=A0A4Z2G2G9_9TELE|nr:hypothetical protein EYF80_042012 [Liparis tanakae]